MRLRSFRILLDPTPTEGGNGGGDPPPKTEDKGPDLVKAVEGLLSKYGDPTAALKVLLGENHSYRDQLRDVKAKLPAEGHVVLDPDKAKLFAAYQAHGTPDEIKAGLYERDELSAEVTATRRAKQVSDVAKVASMDPDVLTTLAGDLEFEVKDEKDKAGKDVKVAYVKDGDKLVPLEDHAKAKWEKFLPSLKPAQTKVSQGGSPFSSSHTPPKPPIPKTDAPRRSLVR